jgi:ubiquinone/menaquinone biosynthesis C-methylase UbiE
MTDLEVIAKHYTHGNLLGEITLGVEKLGKTSKTVAVEDLAPVDEFHIGGSLATRSFLDQVAIAADDHVLDIGCGLGGASRLAAQTYGCRVTGIDLTATYVETGKVLCSWVGLENRVNLIQGNALAMDFSANSFNKAFMLHVGMNIADKESLAEEVWRILKPGGVLGIYDVMRFSNEKLTFPVPWATEAESSSVATPDEYKHALSRAGFMESEERNCRDFAIAFFEKLRFDADAAQTPPSLGLHILMGENASMKVQNMIENISQGIVAPVELIAKKPS